MASLKTHAQRVRKNLNINKDKRSKKQSMKTLLIAAFFFVMAGGAAAAEFSELQAFKAGDIKPEGIPAAAAVPVPAVENTLAISGNAALLDEFKNSFGYKVNGQSISPTGWRISVSTN